jgi:hypothetical protein
MEGTQLFFWKTGPNVKLSPPEIARELLWGEEVHGLIDLPVREILDRIKAVFAQSEEKSGLLTIRAADGHAEISWGWQFVRAECHDLPAAERERLIDAVEAFDCMAYEPPASGPASH